MELTLSAAPAIQSSSFLTIMHSAMPITAIQQRN
jgi:hypothetical protein